MGHMAFSQTSEPIAEVPLSEVEREESKNLYNSVPDIRVQTLDKSDFYLSELWTDKPVLLTMFYNNCSGTCSPFLQSLDAAIEKVGGLGEDFRVVSVSFDSEDSLKDVDTLAVTLGIKKEGEWFVGVTSPKEIDQLAEAIGFWYKKDPRSDQFDHPSMVAAVKDGKVVRVLLGSIVNPSRLKEVIYELKGVFIPFYSRPGENVIFRCLQINEKTQTVQFSWGMLLMFLPGFFSLFGALFIFKVFKKKEEPTS